MLSRYSSGAVPKAARHLRSEERLSLSKLILEWHLEREDIRWPRVRRELILEAEFRREGKEKHLPGSRVQTVVSLQYRRGVLGLGNYLHPKYAFLTCSKHKFIWFTDQNVCSWFHQLLTFLPFFFQLEITVLDLLPLYFVPTSHLSWKIPLHLYPRVQKMGGIFTALDCWAVAQGDAGEKSLKHVAWMYTWTSPAQLGSPLTALHVFRQGVSDPVRLCSDMRALLQPFTVFFRLFSMWFHSVTWQRARGRHGKDQCKLLSHIPPWQGHTQGWSGPPYLPASLSI